MKNIVKRIFAAAIACTMAVPVFSGCASIGNKVDSDTIKVMLSGQKPKGWDDVLNEYNENGAKETGVKLDVEWVSQGDYKEKLNLRMIGSENYDLVFDAPFNKLKNFAAYEMYTPLEDYLESGAYPNLSKAFPEEIADANHYFGHLYGLPMMRTYGNGVNCVYYRKDLAKKYGIGKDGQIDSYDQLQQFFDAIAAGDEAKTSNMVPFGVTGSRGFYTLFASDSVDMAKNHIVRMSLGSFAHVLLNEDNTEVVDIVYEGEDPSRYAAFPEKYRDGEIFGMARLKKLREWNKYLERDSLNRKESWAMVTGMKAAAMVDNLDTYEQKVTDLASALPDAELGVFIIEDGVRNMEPEARATDLKGNNFICIPAWSKKTDKVLTFLDWLYADKENHDLFELGIEGKNWNAVGDDKYEVLKNNGEQYSFPGYVLTWNPNFVRFQSTLPEDIYEYKKYDLEKSSYYESPLAGFMFDTSKLQTETSVISGITSKVSTALEHGALDNPVEVKRENTAECLANGLDVIREEAKRQINEFLKEKNSK